MPKTITLLRTIAGALALFLNAPATPAQTFTVLKHLGSAQPINGTAVNADGAQPTGRLSLYGGFLYGTTSRGGAHGSGTVFRIRPDGSGYVVLHTFDALGTYPNVTNSDGAYPTSRLTPVNGVLYGTAPNGGIAGNGTIFAVNTNGTGFTVLKQFSAFTPKGTLKNSDGANPQSELTFSDGVLYGGAVNGGQTGNGTIFKINTDGTGFSLLREFSAGTYANGKLINEDGAAPLYLGMAIYGDVLFGTTVAGGTGGGGTIFRTKTDGTQFTNLYNFDQLTGASGPQGALAVDGFRVYGTARFGGPDPQNDDGVVFEISQDGTDFTVLKHFPLPGDQYGPDGNEPWDGVILSGNVLYGTASLGGTGNNGTIFKLFTDGTGFAVLKNLSTAVGESNSLTNTDGAFPWAGLTLDLNTLYGAASSGGSGGGGTLFSLGLFQSSQQYTINTTDGQVGFTKGQFGFTLQGPIGSTVVVYTSSNAQDWVPISTVVLTTGSLYFSDSSADDHTNRYYEAKLQP